MKIKIHREIVQKSQIKYCKKINSKLRLYLVPTWFVDVYWYRPSYKCCAIPLMYALM